MEKSLWEKKSYKLANLDKDWLRKNQDDILMLCITGMNEIII